jgi:DNA-binding NarL/FixJ family response regulator
MSELPQIKLLIADDHEMVRLGLRSLLESNPRIRVVGEATSPQHAVYQTSLLRPDVAVGSMPAARSWVATWEPA